MKDKHYGIHSVPSMVFVALIMLVLSFMACGSGDNNKNGSPFLTAGQAVIGSGGGTVATSDGKVSIHIPAGALSENTNVSVSSTDLQGSVGDVYEFGPSGTSFSQPVEVTISYDPASLPVDTTEDDLFMLTETEDGYLEALTDLSIDKINHRISGKTSHFSPIWISISKPVVDNSNLPLTSESIPIATSFRMSIGDSRDLSNKVISCNDSQSQSSEDLGDNIKLLTISSYGNNYPKISFNASGTSNKWLVGTAFNRNQYLTNYDTGSLGQYNSTGDFHPGEDWNRIDAQDGGRPIHAIADGIILFNQKQWAASSSKADQTIGFGNIVVIGHKLSDGRIIASAYGHMKDLSPCLVGKRVNKGDIIGLIGTTGGSTSNHLHFEIIKIKKDVEKASSNVWKYDAPIIDKNSKQIYIRYSEQKDKRSGNITGERGWYWPKTETKIRDNYEDPSNFIIGFSSSVILTSVAVTPANPSIAKGLTKQFTATGAYSDGSTANITGSVTWTSGTTTVATVNTSGLAAGVGVGTSTITAASGTISGSTTLTVTVANSPSAFQVTTNGSSVQPTWSLDGNRLAYQSTINGITNIWTINIDGTNPLQITNMPGILYGINRSAWGPVYQPNSNQIYYIDNSTTGADFHWIVKTSNDGSTGRNPVMMVPGGHTFSAPKFSLDGSKFCYVQYNPYATIKFSIMVANADGSNPQLIMGDNSINYAWTHSVSWGRGINSDKLLYTKTVNGVVSFYVVKTEGAGETKITDSSIASGYDVDWSPDGTKIIFTGKDSQLYVMNSDGSNIQQITNDAYENSQGEFSPDGLKIAYVSKRNGAYDIYRVDLTSIGSGTPFTATAIETGSVHTCALLSDTTVKCWGYNGSGQLGNGTFTNSSIPVPVSNISTATAITAGFTHTCSLLPNKSVQCWGGNRYGSLGDGTTTYYSSTPVTVSAISTAVAIGAGAEHTCAILFDGTIKCWGRNDFGQIGNGTSGTNSFTPVAVSGVTNAIAIKAGQLHTCALLGNGMVKCWGLNDQGQLGNGTTGVFSSIPVPVIGINNAIAISTRNLHTCALLGDGTVKCWGNNGSGQLGNGTFTNSSSPVAVLGITNSIGVATGQGHTCVLLSEGAVKCWGKNDSGQLGNGTFTSSSAPVTVDSMTSSSAIVAGDHTCALLSSGTIQCWGENDFGQIGNGTNINSSIPVTVLGF